MKTVEEILKGLSVHCGPDYNVTCAGNCPYDNTENGYCLDALQQDVYHLLLRLLGKSEAQPLEVKLKASEELLRAIEAGLFDDQEDPDTLCPPNSGHDPVNHPSHYTQGGIECIDALEAATMGLEGIEAVCTANAIKYAWRWKQKNGVEDIDKAIWYLTHLKGHLTEEEQS